jgi:hypothetical protein
MINYGGMLLIKTYFDVPFYINLADGKLPEYFISKYNITDRKGRLFYCCKKGRPTRRLPG